MLEKDELSFKAVYMGLAMVHGDIIEKIPEITSTDGLEYNLTTAIQRMNNKISALLRLSENIQIKLFLSPSLKEIAPLVGLEGLSDIENSLDGIIKELNAKSYERLEFTVFAPEDVTQLKDEIEKYDIISLEWPEVPEHSIPAGKGVIGLVAEYSDRMFNIPLIRQYRIPLLGTQYELTDPEQLKEILHESIESLIEINDDLGYLADHGCVNPWAGDMNMPGMPAEGSVSNFNGIVSRTYNIKEVRLTDNEMLDGLDCLIIAGPREPFTEFELFRIDQFLMKGKSLALFLDTFEDAAGQQGVPAGPINTGIETLLNHYGIDIKKTMVLDESCYKTTRPKEYGGGEQPYYYIIRVMDEVINKDLAFMRNIRALFIPEASPLEPDHDRIKKNGLTANRLLSSSLRSWEQESPNLNPLFMQPPSPDEETGSFALAYMLEGEFPSLFAGKPVPEAVKTDEDDSLGTGDQEDQGPKKADMGLSKIKSEGSVISRGKHGKIFITGTSEVLKNNLIDPQGTYPNGIFIMNIIDYLNNREETAVMRAKTGNLNPLKEVSPRARDFIKYFNMIGLPLLVIIFGLMVWFYRTRRKRKIQELFKN